MKIIKDIQSNAQQIQKTISKYGHLAQHHFHFYLNYSRKNEKNVFFEWDGNQGLFAYQRDNIWRVLTDPIALQRSKKKIIFEFFDWTFTHRNIKKIILEDMTEDFWKEIVEAVKSSKFRAAKPSYVLLWPLIDLEDWSEKLEGKKWKRLRNMRNKFFKENQVQIKESYQIKKEDLTQLVFKWEKQRGSTDKVHSLQYLRFINNDFQGCDLVRIMLVNNRPVSINAGWNIPNSRDYYSCIGLYDYSYRNIGEVSYLDELTELKRRNYQLVDFGGSEEKLLAFKMKFHPAAIYKTYTFSVFRK
ncbi:MAG: hypothetical protein AUJ32_02535 [Parcubacteria group bacterium CG1_02_40_82]|uniref:Phosphatidylglycerol lysyltransferase C-terminal domain-containing protein n=3 Tax=Candidatus Portnoyibacteriota TaxID=1817913 RepID=A0A2M7IH50_9BACT|nr:MAG: hypothetical protein AUJ32_02535 [Parcubacteria group bacterium CG1_02_40_82]PIS30563.1 MAG: hypothetical protein COT41_03305 [Candidatus Portnoybacteria bacterium CG08_land_8_20_14_0_20_40_83]PIW75866.1 MAG: hypothetical protein CO001_04415 [Candidatus Portnoybacteria bacterium CG_4_8_14_3_um_filter_40_10]